MHLPAPLSAPWSNARLARCVLCMATMLLCFGLLACQNRQETTYEDELTLRTSNDLPATSPTRAMAAEFNDQKGWYQQMTLLHSRHGWEATQGEPVLLHLAKDRFMLSPDHGFDTEIFVNARLIDTTQLKAIRPEQVRELFVMHRSENQVTTDGAVKPYQILIETQPTTVPPHPVRDRFFTFLRAAALSAHPLGNSHAFSMNQLLEATFFHNKNALVERTRQEHLRLYDEFRNQTEIYINNLPATPSDVESIHVREVARVYTQERPFYNWMRTDTVIPRFVLSIKTEPKRARRDSSYYVFSPFYTGDF